MSRRDLVPLAFLLVGLVHTPADAGDFPEPPNTERATTRPLPPAAAAAGFRVPPGFRVNVFAAEPEVQNPVAMAWDTRGRLWIAENLHVLRHHRRGSTSVSATAS